MRRPTFLSALVLSIWFDIMAVWLVAMGYAWVALGFAALAGMGATFAVGARRTRRTGR